MASAILCSDYAVQDDLRTADKSATCRLVTLALHVCSYVATASTTRDPLEHGMLLNCADLYPQLGGGPRLASLPCITITNSGSS